MPPALIYSLASVSVLAYFWLAMDRNRRILAVAGFLLVQAAICYQAYFLSKDMLRGDGSATRLLVPPLFGFMRVPPTPLSVRHDGVNRLAADFAAVYFTSQSPYFFKDAYYRQTSLDPWRRPSRTAPLTHYLCYLTLCQLPYGHASVLHILVQLLLFYAGFGFAIFTLGLGRHTLALVTLTNLCIFLTPAGLGFLERGQWSLYVASSYLWLTLAFIHDRQRYAVLSALFAFVKWHALPCLFVMLVVHALNSRDAAALKRRLSMAGVFLLVTLAQLALFPIDGMHFLDGLASQEMNLTPQGVSLARLAPRLLVKAMPLILIAIGALQARRARCAPDRLIPFFAGVAIATLTYPTLAFEYSVPYVLGFLPAVVYWAGLPGLREDPKARVIMHGFFAFLVLASFSGPLFQSETILLFVYLGFSLVFLIAPRLFSKGLPAGLENPA